MIKAVLKLSAQEGRVAGANLDEQLDNMERLGFEGLEVGGRGLPGRVKQLQAKLKGRPIKIRLGEMPWSSTGRKMGSICCFSVELEAVRSSANGHGDI